MQHETTKISTPQLVCLMAVSSVTLMLTCNTAFLGGGSLTDNFVSCGIALGCNFLLALPVFFLMRRRPDSGLLLQAESAGRWLLWITACFYILYFLLVDLQYLATFQFFLGNVFHPAAPTWIFSAMIMLAAVYSAMKGLEAMSRSSVVLLVLILLGVSVLGILLLPEVDSQNFMPLFYNGASQTLYGTAFYLSGSSCIATYAVLFSAAGGRRKLGFCVWNIITFASSAFVLFLIIGALGSFANLQLFPLYSAATLAALGTFQRMDSVFLCIWLVGLFLKLAIDLYVVSLCVNRLAHKRLDRITKPACGVLICAGAVGIAGSRTLLSLFLNPLLAAPLTLAAAGLFPLAALLGNGIRLRGRRRQYE